MDERFRRHPNKLQLNTMNFKPNIRRQSSAVKTLPQLCERKSQQEKRDNAKYHIWRKVLDKH